MRGLGSAGVSAGVVGAALLASSSGPPAGRIGVSRYDAFNRAGALRCTTLGAASRSGSAWASDASSSGKSNAAMGRAAPRAAPPCGDRPRRCRGRTASASREPNRCFPSVVTAREPLVVMARESRPGGPALAPRCRRHGRPPRQVRHRAALPRRHSPRRPRHRGGRGHVGEINGSGSGIGRHVALHGGMGCLPEVHTEHERRKRPWSNHIPSPRDSRKGLPNAGVASWSG